MYLLNYRITHHSAKIAELECTRFNNFDGFYEAFSKNSNIIESLILQTCNRNEFYFIVKDLSKAISQINQKIQLSDKFEKQTGLSVIDHLFQVASGIDSLVIGEDQILSQIKDSFNIAQEKKAVGPVLSHIFQKAMSIGKKIRHKTEINKGSVSIGSIAVDYCKKIFGTIQDQVITVIGAGKIATLVAKSLLRHNIKATFVSNRTFARAIRLAKELGGQALRLDELNNALLISDIVILATSAPHPILTKIRLEKIMKKRDGKELVIIDISIPRNIENGLEIPNLKVYDIDEFKSLSKKNRLKRLDAIDETKQIIKEALEVEERYFRQQFIKPLIASIYSNAEEIRKKELEKLIKILKNPSSNDIESLDKFSRALVNKIFADFSSSIKNAAENSGFSPFII
ncbi:MAG: glutamyl-tRNA reductase [Candidatus Helarchaeota archaeon]|nr:glutamyl-tRNA reductase [Candidatus Helarchaeota archaeon]